ncbi:MAG: sigma-70 family RNA polymerase sigma factor [Gammaproteobacteria bacterium]|jgi:RNA polymerase sigma-70 factor (ECF subfamily)
MSPNTAYRRLFTNSLFKRSRTAGYDRVVEALHAHAGLILNAARRVLGNMADAQDVAQDIAEKLLRSPPEHVASWPALLKTMAVNRALDQLRSRREWSELPELECVETPETRLSDEQRARTLRAAIAALPERDGLLFSLYYAGDLSQVDIAGELGMTSNAVGVAIHRLRRRLTRDVRVRLGLDHMGDD